MEHLQFNEDGTRTLLLPNTKKKMQVDLLKMTEKQRLKLLRQVLKAKAGIVGGKDSEEDVSDDDARAEYMFPEEEFTA